MTVQKLQQLFNNFEVSQLKPYLQLLFQCQISAETTTTRNYLCSVLKISAAIIRKYTGNDTYHYDVQNKIKS